MSRKSPVAKIASKYIEMQSDGVLLSNKHLIQVMDARILELLERVEENETPDRMRKIVGLWEQVSKMFPRYLLDSKESAKIYNAFDDEMKRAYHDYESWAQVFQAFDLRRKTAEGEMRILKDMQALITAEDAMEIAGQLLAAVMLVLRDKPDGETYLRTIHAEFARILGEGHAGAARDGAREIVDVRPSEMDRNELLYTGDEGGPGTEGEDTAD